jgi:hypothetical protein
MFRRAAYPVSLEKCAVFNIFYYFCKKHETMDLSKILSISGKRGLFKVVSQLKNAVLVESLLDGKRFPAFAHEKISSLEEIAVFTTGEDIQLKDLLKKMHEKLEGKPGPDAGTDDKALKVFFLEVIPDYDPDRVYASDIRKIVSWYNLLLEHNLLDFTEKEEEKPAAETEEAPKGEAPAETAKEAPKAKKTVKKEAGTEKKEKTPKAPSKAKPKKSEE